MLTLVLADDDRVAAGEHELSRVAARRARVLADLGDRGAQLVDRQRRPEPAVADPARAAERGRRVAADQDRDRAGRPRPEVDGVEAVGAALEARRLPRPARAPDPR